MFNTNTNTNNGHNRNQNSRRGERGQGDPIGGGHSNCRNGYRNMAITKYEFEGKMKDGPISRLSITEIGQKPTQFKKITDTLPILCANNNFQGLDAMRPFGPAST